MSSQLSERLGVQTPQIVHRPPDVASLAAAEEAIELAERYELADGYPLDDSQQFTLRVALGERADGSWAAATVADFEPRQNGKNDTVAARELAGLILFEERLIIHTAHEMATAKEAFRRIETVFLNWDDLRRRVARFRYSNEEQGIEFLSGQRLLYKARTGKGARGFAKADLVVYDEAQHAQPEHLAASGPARLANPNSQAWYLGSGGFTNSEVAWRLRKRALAGDAGRLGYVEHTAERVSLVDGQVVSTRPDPLDREAWALANPAYGWRISDEAMQGLYDELGPDLFAHECLCVWDAEAGTGLVIPAGWWASCRDEQSLATGPVAYAVDVSPDRVWASVAVAAESSRGGFHIELVDRRRGVAWLPGRLAELRQPGKVAIAKGSPAWSLTEELEATKIDLLPISTEEHSQACGDLYDAISESKVRHIGQDELNAAVTGADRRWYQDAWLWSRRNSTVDISPLVAVTLAHWVAQKRQRKPKIL